MNFFNSILFWGILGGVGLLVPILLHLLNRSSARQVDWGAMRFLEESMARRSRRIRLEDALLLACRCLLLALLALALARPFAPPGASVPWLFVLPLLLLGIAGLGAAVALWSEPRWRWAVLAVSFACLLLGGALVVLEKRLGLARFGGGGARDVVLVIDASASTQVVSGGRTNGVRLVELARQIVDEAPRGCAFGVVAGGPVPRALTGAPAREPAELQAALDAVRPEAGTLDVPASLRAAVDLLDRGVNPRRHVVLLTDGQRHGWQLEDPAAWGDLDALPSVMLRRLAPPEEVANLCLSAVAAAREVVGTDRPLRLEVTVQNTGSLTVTPGALRLRIAGEEQLSSALGPLAPDAAETLVFLHQFEQPGTILVEAEVEVTDDIGLDNRRALAVNVIDSLRVVLVEGWEDAASFAALALSPAEDPLIESRVIPHADFDGARDLEGADAVVLCDVPALAPPAAAALAAWVERGGGLLVANGPRSRADVYNAWHGARAPVLPARLLERITPGPDQALQPALSTLDHPALAAVADPDHGDFDEVLARLAWKLEDNDRAGGRWSTGDPLLVAGTLGEGRVLQLAFGLDAESSNLPARSSFVPFLHELASHLAAPSRPDLNLQPAEEVMLPFAVEAPVVQAPDGRPRPVESAGALTLVQGGLVPGRWFVAGTVPPAFDDGSGRAPFTVQADPEEGDLDPLSASDLAEIGNRVELVDAESVEEVVALLGGEVFGKELWKLLVLGVLGLLLAETVLTRWIGRRRLKGR